MTRQVDLINVFNSAGVSAYSETFYLERIRELEEECQRLARLYAAAARRLNGENDESQ